MGFINRATNSIASKYVQNFPCIQYYNIFKIIHLIDKYRVYIFIYKYSNGLCQK